jgi:hypothetical protein
MKRILLLVVTASACFPARAAQTNDLPPLTEILQRAVARADVEDANDWQFGRHYHYVRTRLTEYRNAKGELKCRELKRSDEGVALDAKSPPPMPATLTNQLAKLNAASKAAAPSAPISDTHSNVRGKAVEMADFSGSLLERFDFTLVGRMTNNGRATFVVDFAPKKTKLPERTFKDKFINKAAGRAWIDAEDAAVARTELHLMERVNLLGGLAGAVWKFNYAVERVRTPEGWWYARQVDWHLEGREVFLNRTVDYHEQKTNAARVFDASVQ